jgi:hypothetical protein
MAGTDYPQTQMEEPEFMSTVHASLEALPTGSRYPTSEGGGRGRMGEEEMEMGK